MSNDPTNTIPPAVPEWVKDIRRASIGADEYLMPAERALLDAVSLLLRARGGRTMLDEPKATVRLFIRDALEALDGEGRS